MDERSKTRGGPLCWVGRRSKRFWIGVAAMPILYVASFGPACWIAGRTGVGDSTVSTMYAPLMKAARNLCLANLLWEYSALAGDEACRVGLCVAFESTRYDQ